MMISRERWMELLEASPAISADDLKLLVLVRPKRTKINVAVQLAIYGVAVVGFG